MARIARVLAVLTFLGLVAGPLPTEPDGPCRVLHYGGRERQLVRVEGHRLDRSGRAVQTTVRSGTRPTDVLMRATRTFDRAGRLVTEVTRRWFSEQRRWDKEELRQRWDASGHLLVEERRAAKGPPSIVRHEYDAQGRRASSVALAGTKALTRTTYAYDEQGRLGTESYGPASGPPSWTATYSYDAAGRLQSQSHPTTGTTTFERDAAGRVVRELTLAPDGKRVQDVQRRYDSDGREVERTVVAAVVGGEETRRTVFEYACPGAR